MTAPPLQPRPATTGALDLMLPLQPKLLPGYNLQSSFLSSTLSTVRPPDLIEKEREFKPSIEVIVEKRESISESSAKIESCDISRSEVQDVNNVESDNCNVNDNCNDNDAYNDVDNANDEINSNIIEKNETSVVSSSNDESPNNNSY